jgi:hypothetical protein
VERQSWIVHNTRLTVLTVIHHLQVISERICGICFLSSAFQGFPLLGPTACVNRRFVPPAPIHLHPQKVNAVHCLLVRIPRAYLKIKKECVRLVVSAMPSSSDIWVQEGAQKRRAH